MSRSQTKRTTDESVVLDDIEARLEEIFDDYHIHDIPLGLVGILDVALTEINTRKKELRNRGTRTRKK